MSDSPQANKSLWIVAGITVLAASIGTWYILENQRPAPKPAPPEQTEEAPTDNTPKYPVDAIQNALAEPEAPLPDLFDSDGYVRDALISLLANPSVADWLVSEHLIARFVGFVDALPARKLPVNLWPLKPARGKFLVASGDQGNRIDPGNSARYDAHVTILEQVDTRAAVALYVKLYPLLQQSYRELGYPEAHFNDRFVAVLDHLLDAPTPPADAALVIGDHGWAYADANFENASAGHKFMMRIGPAHQLRVKAKLRALRAALAAEPMPEEIAKPAPATESAPAPVESSPMTPVEEPVTQPLPEPEVIPETIPDTPPATDPAQG